MQDIADFDSRSRVLQEVFERFKEASLVGNEGIGGFVSFFLNSINLFLQPTIEHALQLFPSFIKYPDVADQILALFLNVLSILQQHVGEEGTKHAIQVFLQVAIRYFSTI